MKLIITRASLHQVLLALCVLVLLFNSYELTFSIWFMTVLFTVKKSYSLNIIKYILISLLILLIAFFSSFFNYHKDYNFIRDITYLAKPILGLLIGYNICKTAGKNTKYTIVYIGVALSIIHILILGICYSAFGIRDVHQLRYFGGYFNDFEIYVLIFLIFHKKFQLEFSNSKLIFFIIIISVSSFLYFARTNFIQFIILFIAMKGYFKITKKALVNILISVSIILGSYAAIYYSNPTRKGKGIEAFLYKVKIAPIESFKTKINESDWKDFNDNYRSFENIMTVRQVTKNGTQTILLGKGLGSTIDIGRQVMSNDGEFIRYIPTLHNAYMTMYLKAGLLGVFFLLLFIYFLLKQSKTEIESIKEINYLIVGSAIFLILSNWIFMGLYLKLDNKSIFLGFLLCYKELLLKEHKSISLKLNG